MKTNIFNKTLPILALLALFFSSNTFSQKWYSVELIFFEHVDKSGVNSEKWDQDKDILKDEPINLVKISPINASGARAFGKIADEDLTLNTTAARIESSSAYRLIAHFGWNQPGLNRMDAVPVKIQLGKEYLTINNSSNPFDITEENGLSESYSESISDSSADKNELDTNDTPNEQSQTNKIIISDSKRFQTEETTTSDKTPTILTNATASQLTANGNNGTQATAIESKWKTSYEVEGWITLILERYLHIQTNLVYNLPTQLYSSDSSNSNETEMGGAIEAETIKIPLVQRRRMRSTEVHHIDNPAMGIIVKVTPYKVTKREDTQVNESETSKSAD